MEDRDKARQGEQGLLLQRTQPSRPAWVRFGSQGWLPTCIGGFLPTEYRRRRGAHQTSYLAQALVFFEQLAGNPPTHFQRFCTTLVTALSTARQITHMRASTAK
jgi:hypothetical protein